MTGSITNWHGLNMAQAKKAAHHRPIYCASVTTMASVPNPKEVFEAHVHPPSPTVHNSLVSLVSA